MQRWLTCLGLLLSATALAAQAPVPKLAQATLTGVVRNDSSGAPLEGVEVILNGTTHRAETNAEGRYTLDGLPPGVYQVIFRKVGHLPVRVDSRLVAGETTRANASLIESAVVLNPIIVTGQESKVGVGVGREAFEERRRLGFGRYFDTETLRRIDQSVSLPDLLVRDGGVKLAMIDKQLAAVNRIRTSCVLQVYYNGVPIGRGGVRGVSMVNPTDLRQFMLTGLDGIELYRSAAEVPQEYGGANAGCGVLLLWSRVKP